MTPTVDAHLHLWDPSTLAPPWLADVPALHGRFDLERYRREGGTAEAIVVVEADVAVADRIREAKVLAASGSAGARCAVIAGLGPGEPSFTAELGHAVQSKAIPGGRRVLHGGSFRATEAFIADLGTMAAADRSFDFCVRCGDLPEVTRCLRAVPSLQAIVDHLGNPPIRAGWDSAEADAWRRDVRQMAACPNAFVKWSAMFENAGRAIDLDTARPWFRWCLDAFGPERMMWGSNWPVCFPNTPLSSWLRLSERLLDEVDAEARADLMGRTATAVYRLEK
jgi:L-fuconolactonase